MNLIEWLQNRNVKIEEMRKTLFELQHGLLGKEVNYNGEEALIMEIDWKEKQVYLNYDDERFEWVSFE